LTSGQYGWAKYYFDQTEGEYTISIPYYDENNGVTDATMRVNGVTLEGWDWDGNTEGTWEMRTTDPHSFYSDDVTMLKMYKDGEEMGYVDYVEFQPTGFQKKIADDKIIFDKFRLYANFPNPFNPTTTIKYDLPEARRVTIKIYNITGQLVETLVDDTKDAGSYKIVWNAAKVASGLYFCRLKAGSFHEVKKMLVIK